MAGNHNMAATRVHNYLLRAAQQVETDLLAMGELSTDTRAVLRMLNVGHVICSSLVANGCPDIVKQAVTDPVLGWHLALPTSPALFSQVLARMPNLPELEKPMLWPWDYQDKEHHPRIAALRSMLRRVVAAEKVTADGSIVAAVMVRDTAASTEG